IVYSPNNVGQRTPPPFTHEKITVPLTAPHFPAPAPRFGPVSATRSDAADAILPDGSPTGRQGAPPPPPSGRAGRGAGRNCRACAAPAPIPPAGPPVPPRCGAGCIAGAPGPRWWAPPPRRTL